MDRVDVNLVKFVIAPLLPMRSIVSLSSTCKRFLESLRFVWIEECKMLTINNRILEGKKCVLLRLCLLFVLRSSFWSEDRKNWRGVFLWTQTRKVYGREGLLFDPCVGDTGKVEEHRVVGILGLEDTRLSRSHAVFVCFNWGWRR